MLSNHLGLKPPTRAPDRAMFSNLFKDIKHVMKKDIYMFITIFLNSNLMALT